MNTNIIYGIDGISISSLLDSNKVMDIFHNIVSNHTDISKDDLCLIIDEVLESKSVNDYSSLFNHLVPILESLALKCDLVSSDTVSIIDCMVSEFNPYFSYEGEECDIILFELVSDIEKLLTNFIIGFNVSTLLSSNKEMVKDSIKGIYLSLGKLLRDDVTIFDFIDSFKYHTVVSDNDSVVSHVLSDTI